MCLVEAEEYVATRIRTSGKLNEKGGEQIAARLLVDISKVEIKVCHRS